MFKLHPGRCANSHFFRSHLPCRRTLFGLPDLSSLSPFVNADSNPEPQKYHERKILPYNRRQLYEVVANVESYPLFVPFCTGSRILHSSRGDRTKPTTMDAELSVGFLVYQESYVSKVTCKPYEFVQADASSSSPLFKTLTTLWQFQPVPPTSPRHGGIPSNDATDEHASPSLVSLDLTYAFASPLHASISAAFFGQVSKLMVRAFEERCLAVYGPGRE
ncbi:hypothetical protein PC9H_005350 [Pleurotus ostreatus]|uniref:Coenzyme Q-binding protein COQ10 START domain-containing protein n=1 Tax=Pleurotus ostreatus TaxID=5322 RepID=A0A8H6ZWX7_PLEOS|nr:uncharacterized protein PC9H_005350 [Pleurotus ostreatus]KAF7433400.1 hypothetical protein PC9H_005350 [Pleurotus ostreatus]KAJ8697911.1 hypothetical protein PTI98_004681 [Pleurotus ostreatus]